MRLAELHAPGFADARAQAVMGYAFQPGGFPQRQPRERGAALLGKTLEGWSSGRVTYDLQRLGTWCRGSVAPTSYLP